MSIASVLRRIFGKGKLDQAKQLAKERFENLLTAEDLEYNRLVNDSGDVWLKLAWHQYCIGNIERAWCECAPRIKDKEKYRWFMVMLARAAVTYCLDPSVREYLSEEEIAGIYADLKTNGDMLTALAVAGNFSLPQPSDDDWLWYLRSSRHCPAAFDQALNLFEHKCRPLRQEEVRWLMDKVLEENEAACPQCIDLYSLLTPEGRQEYKESISLSFTKQLETAMAQDLDEEICFGGYLLPKFVRSENDQESVKANYLLWRQALIDAAAENSGIFFEIYSFDKAFPEFIEALPKSEAEIAMRSDICRQFLLDDGYFEMLKVKRFYKNGISLDTEVRAELDVIRRGLGNPDSKYRLFTDVLSLLALLTSFTRDDELLFGQMADTFVAWKLPVAPHEYAILLKDLPESFGERFLEAVLGTYDQAMIREIIDRISAEK